MMREHEIVVSEILKVHYQRDDISKIVDAEIRIALHLERMRVELS